MVTATLTSKGQITIPKTVRDSLRLHTGDRVAFILNTPGEAVLKPASRSVDEVFGKLHQPGQSTRTVDQLNQAIARRIKAAAR